MKNLKDNVKTESEIEKLNNYNKVVEYSKLWKKIIANNKDPISQNVYT